MAVTVWLSDEVKAMVQPGDPSKPQAGQHVHLPTHVPSVLVA